jgi:hypothetical protein
VAALTAFAVGMHFAAVGPVTISVAAAVVMLPVWLPYVFSLRGRAIGVLGIAAIVNGLILNSLMAPTHDISFRVTVAQVLLVLEVTLGAGALVWAAGIIGRAQMAAAFGAAMLMSAGLRGIDADNAWKFTFSVPVIVCVLAVCWWRRAFRVELVALLVLAGICALNDSRSAASILLTSLLILVWQKLRVHLRLRSTALRVLVAVLFVGSVSYLIMQSFILDGYLGENARSRSEAQIRAAGSLLLGGRPEVGATVALLKQSFWGYGMGTVPTFGDVYVAKSGMRAIDYSPNNGYVEQYMFGGGIEVHSVIGDLWLRCGLMGLLLAVTMIATVIWGSARRLARGTGRALTTFLAIQVAWDAGFAPFFTTAAQVLILGIALAVATGTTQAVELPEKKMRT